MPRKYKSKKPRPRARRTHVKKAQKYASVYGDPARTAKRTARRIFGS